MVHTVDQLQDLFGDEDTSLAVAESLTGGLLAAAITAVPGSSAYFLGGVVAYASEVKMSVLGVPEDVVAEHGVVSAECAMAMAEGVRRLLGADVGVSTTGVAGPERQEDKPVGTAYVGVADAEGTSVVSLDLEGHRVSIQQQVVEAAVSAAYDIVSRRREATGLR
ncbi:CinA family protein [Nocardioides montaniterrae]